MNNFVNGYYRISLWIMRLAYLNLLWVSFTIVGIIFLGFMPATVAMFVVIRKWITGEKDIAIFKVFWSAYRKEFLKANLLGYLLFIIGYLLSIEFQILHVQSGFMYLIASYGVLALFILYFIVLLYFFPIFVHFKLKVTDYLKWPFIIGIVHPILTVFLIIGIFTINYVVFLTVPALLFFFGGSVSSYILMWGISKTFSKYELKEQSDGLVSKSLPI